MIWDAERALDECSQELRDVVCRGCGCVFTSDEARCPACEREDVEEEQ